MRRWLRRFERLAQRSRPGGLLPAYFSLQYHLKVFDRLPKPILKGHLWLPSKQLLRLRNVRLALLRIVFRKRLEFHLRPGAGETLDTLREFHNGHLLGIAKIHRIAFLRQSQAIITVYQVLHVTETARLRAVPQNAH